MLTKIRVIKSEKPTYWYAKRIGEVFDGELDVYFNNRSYRVGNCRDGTDDAGYIEVGDCEVATESYAAIIDGLTDTVAKLTLRVTELERKVAAMNIADGLREDTILIAQERRPRTLTRDDIVELAKKDVAELEAQRHGGVRSIISGNMCTYNPEFADSVDFVINREKRTVVALIANALSERPVWARGKARCAPDDCFNVHIGKAVALRRALGLDIPEYYLRLPQPESVRVGDIIRWNYGPPYEVITYTGKRAFKSTSDGQIYPDDYVYVTPGKNVTVIDDSHDGGERN